MEQHQNTAAPSNLGQLYAALAKAQGEFGEIRKNRTVEIRPRDKTPYSFVYADLSSIMAGVRKALADNGLCIMQPVQEGEHGSIVIRTILAHASGATVESSMRVGRDFSDPKQFGALVTYLRRYCVSSILCIAADDDIDEDGDEGGSDHPIIGSRREPANDNRKADSRGADSRGATGGTSPYPDADFKRNLPAYAEAVKAGQQPKDIIAMLSSKRNLTEEQKQQILALGTAHEE